MGIVNALDESIIEWSFPQCNGDRSGFIDDAASRLVRKILPGRGVNPGMIPYSNSDAEVRGVPARIIAAIARRKWLLLSLWLGTVLVAGVYCVLVPPLYRSTALVRIEPETPYSQALAGMFKSLKEYSDEDDDEAEDERERRASSTSFRAMNRLRLENADSGRPETRAPAPPAPSERRREKPVVRFAPTRTNAAGDSELIQLDATASDPVAAREMLTAFLNEYQQEQSADTRARIDRLMNRLEKELANFERQMEVSKRELIEFTTAHGMMISGDRITPVGRQFEEATNRLVQSRLDRWNMETRAATAAGKVPRGNAGDDARVMRAKLEALQREYDPDGDDGSGPKHALLKRRIQALRLSARSTGPDAPDSSLSEARIKEKAAEDTYARLKREAIQSDTIGLRYEVLRQVADADERLVFEARRKLKELRLYDGLRRESVIVESAPSLPSTPVRPQKAQIMLSGTVLGLLLGLGAVVGLDLLDKRVKTRGEITSRLGGPVLGEIPKVEALRETSAASPAKHVVELMPCWSPVSPFSDAVRIIHNSVFHAMGSADAVLAFSSALPGEGKTFVALGFAAAVASESGKALFIDADLRRSRLQETFQTGAESAGLTELLAKGGPTLEETIRSTSVPRLDYVGPGRPPDNPVAVLKSPAMADLLARCRALYDVVVIDCPPIIGLADALIVGAQSDGLVMVVRHDYVTADALAAARRSLESARVRLIGTVVNMVDEKAVPYRGYRYLRSYYQSNERPRPAA